MFTVIASRPGEAISLLRFGISSAISQLRYQKNDIAASLRSLQWPIKTLTRSGTLVVNRHEYEEENALDNFDPTRGLKFHFIEHGCCNEVVNER